MNTKNTYDSRITVESNCRAGQELITALITEALEENGFSDVDLRLKSPQHRWGPGSSATTLMEVIESRNPTFFESKIIVVAGIDPNVPDVRPENPLWRPKKPQPRQPVVIDERGTARFRPNLIVDWLSKGRMNEIAVKDFPREDREQLAQLIGYSVSGFGGLSYATDEVYNAADAEATELIKLEPQVPVPAPLQLKSSKELTDQLLALSERMANSST